jgi:hypothetical protein
MGKLIEQFQRLFLASSADRAYLGGLLQIFPGPGPLVEGVFQVLFSSLRLYNNSIPYVDRYNNS